VRAEATDGGLRVFVEADGTLQFKEFMLPDPWRIVVDITGVRSAFGNKTTVVGAGLVERFRVGQPSPNVVRLVLDTKSKVSYRVVREGEALVITIGDPSGSREDSPTPKVEVKAEQNPVKDTAMDAQAVATTPSTHRGSTSHARAVDSSRTHPATSQTVRSMYQRSVGTM